MHRMRLNRFIVDLDLRGGPVTLTGQTILKQIKNVLRMKAGDRLILSDGKGKEFLAEVSSITKDAIDADILEELDNPNEPDIHASLHCSILKRENFEWVVQKACEIGVREIVPIISERTVKTGINEERLSKIMKEAAEQSERKFLPTLSTTITLAEALRRMKKDRLNLFFDRTGTPIKDLSVRSDMENLKNVRDQLKTNLFIGPEGGWTGRELQSADENGCIIVQLSKLSLRSETAAVVASYLVCQRLLMGCISS